MAISSLWSNLTQWVRRKQSHEDFPFMPQPEYGWWKGVMKSWPDDAYKLSSTAYQTILRQDVIHQPMCKFAERMSGMTLTVVGSGKRRDELQKIVDSAVGVGSMLYWLSFAKVEGVRFMKHRAVYDEQLEFYVPDFRGCGAKKWKAGGNIYWEGWQADQDNPKRSIGKIEEVSNGDEPERIDAKGAWFDRSEWTVFRPGAGTNPEGDIEILVQYFLLAESAQLLDKAMRVYADRYQLPREMLKLMIDKLRPDELTTRMRSGAAKVKQSDARQRMTMPAETVIELLEPKGTTWEFLTDYRSILERRAHKLIFGEDISSGGQESGDRGGRELGDKQAYAAIVSFGKQISDALSQDWLPWIEELNKESLTKLKKNEPKPYLDLRPPSEKQRLSVAELVQAADRGIPVNADDVYAILGVDRPEGVEDVFKWDHLKQQGQEIDPETGKPIPSNTGETTQRKDREQDDSNMPPEKPQDKQEDLRNVKKDSD